MGTQQEVFHINLLWTGGWDSTFRLLELLLIEGKCVQPYYIVDHARKSTGNEFKAMEAIRKGLFSKRPETQEMLLPTIIANRIDIEPNKAISTKWLHLHKNYQLGGQYEWLALFCEQQGLYDLEMCLERHSPRSRFDRLILPELNGEGHEYRIKKIVK